MTSCLQVGDGDKDRTAEQDSSSCFVIASPSDKSPNLSIRNTPAALTPTIAGDKSPTLSLKNALISHDPHASQTSKMQLLSAGNVPRNSKRPGSISESKRVTMTGMVTRGVSVGQPVEVRLRVKVHVHVLII